MHHSVLIPIIWGNSLEVRDLRKKARHFPVCPAHGHADVHAAHGEKGQRVTPTLNELPQTQQAGYLGATEVFAQIVKCIWYFIVLIICNSSLHKVVNSLSASSTEVLFLPY